MTNLEDKAQLSEMQMFEIQRALSKWTIPSEDSLRHKV